MEWATPEVTKIAIAFIGSFFTTTTAIAVAVINMKNAIKQKQLAQEAEEQARAHKEEAEKAKFESHVLKQDLAKFLMVWAKTFGGIEKLINETEIDRFLMLTAINGIQHPNYVTAYFQKRTEDQKEIKYEDIEIDNHYRSLLSEVVKEGYVYFIVEDLPHGALIKRIYELEKVKSSMWVLVMINEFEDGKKSITFASLSTHENGGITADTQTRCLIIKDSLAQAAKAIM